MKDFVRLGSKAAKCAMASNLTAGTDNSIEKERTYPTMYERVVNQLLSTTLGQFVSLRSHSKIVTQQGLKMDCIKLGGKHTSNASVAYKVCESHLD